MASILLFVRWKMREDLSVIISRCIRQSEKLPMIKKLISQGSPFEEKIGYSRAVVLGDWIFVAGTTGYDYSTMSISDDVVVQTEQCLKNIEWALYQAGASLKDIVRVNYILPNRDDWPQCWEPLRKTFGDIGPAATMIVAGLSDAAMKIEIEVTAFHQ